MFTIGYAPIWLALVSFLLVWGFLSFLVLKNLGRNIREILSMMIPSVLAGLVTYAITPFFFVSTVDTYAEVDEIRDQYFYTQDIVHKEALENALVHHVDGAQITFSNDVKILLEDQSVSFVAAYDDGEQTPGTLLIEDNALTAITYDNETAERVVIE